jgi:hypothetical protein
VARARAALVARNRSEYGQAAVDLYTPLHFAFGLVVGALGVSQTKATLVFVAVKVAVAATERGLGHALMGRVPGESNVNELVDLLAEIGGLDVGAKIRERWIVPASAPSPAPAAPQVAAPVSGIFSRRS